MIRKYFLLIISVLFSIAINAQLESKFKHEIVDAEYHFLNEEYEPALKIYLQLIDEMPDNANLNYRAGVCYLNLPFENGRSIPYLKKAITNITDDYKEGSYKETQAPLSSLFYLGYAYHLNKYLDEATVYYNRFRDTISVEDVYNITMVERQIISVNNAKEIIKKPIEVEIQNIGHTINSEDAEYNPAVSANGELMIYTHNRPMEKVDSLDTTTIYMKNLYRDIMVTRKQENGKWSTPENITDQLDAKGECQTLSLSPDGKTLLLYKDDWNDGGLLDFRAGTIYISYYDTVNQKWTSIEKLGSSINSMNWETHACISPDGNSIYFASDRKGGYGGQDLYVAHKDENGEWGEAQNLGGWINTPYDETTPYLLEDSVTLYFSSEGHFNMGGFDIFKATLKSNGQWSTPVNLGYPLNSTGDDLFFVPIKDGNTAFYSAERHEGYFTFGSMDIYQLDILSPEDIAREDSIAQAYADSVRMADSLAVAEKQRVSDSLAALKRDDGKEVYIIRNIYFDFNSFTLNREARIEAEKLFALMSENPGLYIEIIGHTDSKGAADYNKKLSLKRSRAVADYLMKRGVEKTRFVTTGAGESRLLAKETEGKKELSAGQQLNRRVEIKILKTDNDMVVTVEELVPERLRLAKYNRYSVVLSESESKVLRSKFTDLGNSINVLTMQTNVGFLYYFGDYTSKAEAVRDLNSAVSKGFNEAYIIDYFELNKKNKFITTNRSNATVKYTVQLKAADTKLLLDAKVKGVTEHKTKDGFYRYTYKEFTSYDEAEKALNEMVEKGYNDAFIIESYKIK